MATSRHGAYIPLSEPLAAASEALYMACTKAWDAAGPTTTLNAINVSSPSGSSQTSNSDEAPSVRRSSRIRTPRTLTPPSSPSPPTRIGRSYRRRIAGRTTPPSKLNRKPTGSRQPTIGTRKIPPRITIRLAKLPKEEQRRPRGPFIIRLAKLPKEDPIKLLQKKADALQKEINELMRERLGG